MTAEPGIWLNPFSNVVSEYARKAKRGSRVVEALSMVVGFAYVIFIHSVLSRSEPALATFLFKIRKWHWTRGNIGVLSLNFSTVGAGAWSVLVCVCCST